MGSALPFLDRREELKRLRRTLGSRTFACLYGRRRCGKSRLVLEALSGRKAIHYTADEREAQLQLRSLAAAVSKHVPGFDRVDYPGWDELLSRLWKDAPRAYALVIDELPYLVAQAPELPSLLQKYVERRTRAVVLLGSSQRMMQGLVLDATAPLYGRAAEVMKIEPLGIAELCMALRPSNPVQALQQWSTWGGVPRYWELAREHRSWKAAIRDLVLDPLGVLHREPTRLLLDDIRDLAQAASILELVGSGCHRLSEIAGRIGKPATSLSRPIERLCDLGLLRRETPFGSNERDSKRSLYRIADPFLRFWYRFVPKNGSRLALGEVDAVANEVVREMPHLVGEAWEDIVRKYGGKAVGSAWGIGARYWDASVEIDLVAASKKDILVAEVKTSCARADVDRLVRKLEDRAAHVPAFAGKKIQTRVFALDGPKHPSVITGRMVLQKAGCTF